MQNSDKRFSKQYILGLLAQRGSFTFSTRTKYDKNGVKITHRIPTFTIEMNERNKELIFGIKNTLGLTNTIYRYESNRRDGRRRNPSLMLIVREIKNLQNIVVPFFYKKAIGYRRAEVNQWLSKIEKDKLVPFSFKKIVWICRAGV